MPAWGMSHPSQGTYTRFLQSVERTGKKEQTFARDIYPFLQSVERTGKKEMFGN